MKTPEWFHRWREKRAEKATLELIDEALATAEEASATIEPIRSRHGGKFYLVRIPRRHAYQGLEARLFKVVPVVLNSGQVLNVLEIVPDYQRRHHSQ